MNTETAEHVANVLKAVAHPVRLQIVELLQDGEMSVGEIAEGIDEKQSLTSQQLGMMKSRGVLGSRRQGQHTFYYIENMNVIRLLDCIADHCERK